MVHYNLIPETTFMFINRRIGKQNVTSSYNGILFCNRKEKSTDIHENMNKFHRYKIWINFTDILLSERSKVNKGKPIYYIIKFIWSSRTGKMNPWC